MNVKIFDNAICCWPLDYNVNLLLVKVAVHHFFTASPVAELASCSLRGCVHSQFDVYSCSDHKTQLPSLHSVIEVDFSLARRSCQYRTLLILGTARMHIGELSIATRHLFTSSKRERQHMNL